VTSKVINLAMNKYVKEEITKKVNDNSSDNSQQSKSIKNKERITKTQTINRTIKSLNVETLKTEKTDSIYDVMSNNVKRSKVLSLMVCH